MVDRNGRVNAVQVTARRKDRKRWTGGYTPEECGARMGDRIVTFSGRNWQGQKPARIRPTASANALNRSGVADSRA